MDCYASGWFLLFVQHSVLLKEILCRIEGSERDRYVLFVFLSLQ